MTLTLTHPATVADFLALAGDFLIAQEAEHNLLLGLCGTIAAHPEVYPGPRFIVAHEAATVVGAALQTPPHNLALSAMEVPVAVALAGAVDSVTTPGVLGPTAAARAFSDGFRQRTGRPVATVVGERIFRLDRVIAPRPSPGGWRIAEERDRARLVEHWSAFSVEALPGPHEPAASEAAVDRGLRRVGRTLYVWEDRGELVSFSGAGGETPNGIRIGPVYTPPEHRGRGYASNLVAATSQEQLDRGRRFCFLFTNLANPTSNKIYQALGYVPVCDVEQVHFAGA